MMKVRDFVRALPEPAKELTKSETLLMPLLGTSPQYENCDLQHLEEN
jgi:hypothetical protein